MQQAKSLADILPAKSPSARREVLSAIQAREGRGVLFVLDGWDEYGGGFLEELIKSTEEYNIHFSSFIITS